MFKNEIMISGLSVILLGSAILLVFMFFIGGSVYAQQNENVTTSEPRLLGIQTAQSGSVSQVNGTTSTLELSDISDKTILFSDRPDRIISYVDTVDFIGNWSMGPNSFATDPPNAVLVLDDEQRQDLGIIELFNPEYDSEANTLKFDITVENATTTATTSSIGLPGEFGQSTLVIDYDEEPIPIGINIG